MNPFNIAIIEDDENDFYRLRDLIRSFGDYVDKIYACQFESEFYQLANWSGIRLIISDNEIRGRSNAGLNFFKDFYKAHYGKHIFGILYTWGTDDYHSFLIQIRSLHQNHPEFLGAIFKQFGDYNKLLEIHKGIRNSEPFPIFDKQMADLPFYRIKRRQRIIIEQLIDLKYRIQERLSFLIQISRFHLEKRPNRDFYLTLRHFSDYVLDLKNRFDSLSHDLSELLELVKQIQSASEYNELHSLSDELKYLELFLKNYEKTGKSLLITEMKVEKGFLKALFETFSFNLISRINGPKKNESENKITTFLQTYAHFISTVSHVIDSTQLAVKRT